VTFNSAGLGLATLTSGTDFLDKRLGQQGRCLRSTRRPARCVRKASTLGSNLSIVQVRQDFNKSLINVLQTGFVEPDAWPTPTRKRPTARRCRPASRIAVLRAGRWPTSRSRALLQLLALKGIKGGGGKPRPPSTRSFQRSSDGRSVRRALERARCDDLAAAGLRPRPAPEGDDDDAVKGRV